MADKIIENNQVSIMGKIDTGFTFSHQVFGEGFYTMELLVRRLSDSEDRIPVMVSERLLDITQDYTGQYIEIHGQFRSYNRHEEKHNRLVLSVFAREVNFVEEQDESLPVNQIFLDGFICKPPVYRKTPLGREIADMLLPECTITHTEDKNGKKEFYNSDENCTKLKYVVLVNENTASASEIVAAAIKDNGGGKLVGTTTYGKGIIQSTVAFKDGTAMSLTIMQYLSPKNNKIHGIGVKPDYQVDGISGGTITSVGVDAMLKSCLNSYLSFLTK